MMVACSTNSFSNLYVYTDTQNVAFETPFLFKQKAKIKMIEVMEKYAPFIYANAIQTTFNPLTQNMTFSSTESYTKENSESNSSSSSSSGSSSSSSSDSSSGLNVHSNTPQGQISKSNILEGKYASETSANENESSASDSTSTSSNGSLEGESSGSETFSKTKSGFDIKMTNADKIKNYRESIIAINYQIIEELNSLFFALF